VGASRRGLGKNHQAQAYLVIRHIPDSEVAAPEHDVQLCASSAQGDPKEKKTLRCLGFLRLDYILSYDQRGNTTVVPGVF
jgi:hypothetical protein